MQDWRQFHQPHDINKIMEIVTKTLLKHEKLEVILQNLHTTGKIVNMVALRKELDSGGLKLVTVARELLNYSEALDPAAMEKANLTGLPDELAQFVTVVETECAVKGEPCSGFQEVVVGGKYLMGLTSVPQNLSAHFKKGGLLRTLVQVKDNYDAIVVLKPKSLEFQTRMNAALDLQSRSDDSWQGEANDAYNALDAIMKVVNLLSELTSEQIEDLDEKKALGATDDVIQFLNFFSDKNISLEALESKLGLMANALPKLRSIFTRDEVDRVWGMVQLLIELHGGRNLSMSEKKATHGFPNGAKDLEQLSADLKSPFVKDVLTDEAGRSLISYLGQYFFELFIEMKSVLIVRDSADVPLLTHHVKTMKNTLDSAVTDVKSLVHVVPKLFQHFKKFNGVGKSLMSINWSREKQLLEEEVQSDTMKSFCTQTNQVSFKSVALSELYRALKKARYINRMSVWESYQNFDAVKTEVTALINQVNTVNDDLIRNWAILPHMKHISRNSSLLTTELDLALDFLQNKTDVQAVIDAIGDRDSLPSVLSLTNDTSIAQVSIAANGSSTIIDEYAALERRLSSKNLKFFEVTEIMEPINLGVSKDLNEGVMVLSSLLKIYNSEVNLKTLGQLLGDPGTQEWLGNLSQDAQKEYENLLGPTVQKSLVELMESSVKVVESIRGIPKDISGYTGLLEVCPQVPANIEINLRKAHDFMLAHNASKPILDALARVQHLEMGITNGQTQGALNALMVTLPFLMELSWQRRLPPVEKAKMVDNSWNVPTSVAIVFNSVMCLCCVAWLIMVIRNPTKEEDDEEDYI